MVDVGVVLALNAAGERHDGHVERAFGLKVLHDGAHRLAAGDRDDVAVPQCLQQLIGGRPAYLLKRCAWAAGDGRSHHCAGQSRRADQTLFEVDQVLKRALDRDLDHSELAALGDQPADLGRRQVERRRNVVLLHPVDEMQDENGVDLPDRFEIFFALSHVKIQQTRSNVSRAAC